MAKAKIEQILREAFVPDFLEVIDESHKHAGHPGALEGGPASPAGGHFQVTIASKSFQGKSLLEVHRMIFKALQPVKSSIHALSIKVKK